MKLYKVSEIEGKGFGLVATQKINKGTIILRSTLIKLTSRDWDIIDGTTISEYVYTKIKHGIKEHYLCLGDAALINHSTSPNTDKELFVKNKPYSVLLKASCDIKYGEELCIYYTNPSYYNL